MLDGYRPATDAISRLAANGAPTFPILSFGLATNTAGVGLTALALRVVIGSLGATALGLNALLTLGVPATPLEHSPRHRSAPHRLCGVGVHRAGADVAARRSQISAT